MNDKAEPSKTSNGKQKARPAKPVYGSVDWVNYAPNSQDGTWLEANSSEHANMVFTLLEQLTSEEKLSIKFDSHSSRWIAVYFASPDDGRNQGAALSVRASSPFDALVLLAYVHLVVFEGTWAVASVSSGSRWG